MKLSDEFKTTIDDAIVVLEEVSAACADGNAGHLEEAVATGAYFSDLAHLIAHLLGEHESRVWEDEHEAPQI